jgi:Calcium-binding EGF domain
MIASTILLFLVVLGAVSAQRPAQVNICYPVGNSVYSSITVLSTELAKYPGYSKGQCKRQCKTICADFSSSQVNAAGQCTCVGKPLNCGANAKLSSDKKRCVCKVGYNGDAVKGCVDIDECNTRGMGYCGELKVCLNTVGSFTCIYQCSNWSPCDRGQDCVDVPGGVQCVTRSCGANAAVVDGQCQCNIGYEGDATTGCTDINECSDINVACPIVPGGNEGGYVCTNTEGSFTCGDVDECALGTHTCGNYEQTGIWGSPTECVNVDGYFLCKPCGYNAEIVDGRCTCMPGTKGNPKDVCREIVGEVVCGRNAAWVNGTCQCNTGFTGNGIKGCIVDHCLDSGYCKRVGRECHNTPDGAWCR